MGWHGPQGGCGCCNPGPPPPPPCACELNDCMPEDQFQFSGIKAVAEWDDSFVLTVEETRAVTSGACVCATMIDLWTRAYSGMSAVNGTYDAAYVQNNSGELVEADPDEDYCGWWFFPWIEVDLFYTSTFTKTYLNGCNPNFFSNSSRTIPVYYDTYAGVFRTKTDSFPDILFGHPGFNTPVIPVNFTRTIVPYECRPGDDTLTLDGSTLTDGSFFFSTAQSNTVPSGSLITPALGNVGIGPLTQIVTYDGQKGVVRPYRDGSFIPLGNPCQINYESAETTIDAYNQSMVPFNDTCGLYTIPATREFEWNAFRRKHSILLNV